MSSSLYYEDDSVTLYHGDFRDVPEWAGADVLVTDPPYGIGWHRGISERDGRPWHNFGIEGDSDTSARDEALRMWGDGPAVVFGSLRVPFPDGWRQMLVFRKPSTSGLFGAVGPWRRDWEPIFILGEWPRTSSIQSSVVATSTSSSGGFNGYATATGHPHTKPLDVMGRLLAACPAGVVADPFVGSGSTLVAAKLLGRRAVGVELVEAYCEVAAKRLAQGVLPFGSEVTC